MKSILTILLIASLTACVEFEPDVQTLTVDEWDMPMGISSASAFVWSDTLFVLFGREGESTYSPQSSVYAISLADPTISRQWSLPAEIQPRVKASGVLIDNKYYFGLGYNSKPYSEKVVNDWWCWDMTTRKLTRLADFPGIDTDAAVAWHADDSIMVSLGYKDVFYRNTYSYNIATNKWKLLNNISIGYMRAAATGAMAGNRMFAGCGQFVDTKNDWHEYNYNKNWWESRAPLPTRGRVFASAAASDHTVYLLGGRHFGGTLTDEHFYSSVLAYNVANNSWRVIGNAPIAAEHQIAFWYDNALYWGLGQDINKKKIRKLYRYRP